tara:strand:+ start:10007 stop:10600 length:594 start_codon:yes stop_codon:yes gene_type:complete
MLIAIDAGTTHSGYAALDNSVSPPNIIEQGWIPNEELHTILIGTNIAHPDSEVVIEDVSSYGMPVGYDVFQTVRWTGRFDSVFDFKVWYLTRPTVKAALCGDARAKDGNVRQAVIDRYGGDQLAIGGKKCVDCKGKGWRGREHEICNTCHCKQNLDSGITGCGYQTHKGKLYEVKTHVWSALALGIAYMEKETIPQD